MSADDQHTTGSGPEAARCPSCGALTGPRASWCSLCFADLTVPAVRNVPAPDSAEQVRHHGPAAEGADDVAAVDVAPVDVLVAELTATARQPSRLAGVTQFVSTPAARVTVMLLGTLLVTGLGFAVMTVLGSLL